MFNFDCLTSCVKCHNGEELAILGLIAVFILGIFLAVFQSEIRGVCMDLKKAIRFSSRKVEFKRWLQQTFFGSYSQYGEDLIILNALDNKKTCVYVDVGANHPTKFNNTYMLYQRGGYGVNVDPNPNSAEIFNAARERDSNYTCGIASKPGILKFYVFDDNMYSTFSKDDAEKNVADGKKMMSIIDVKVVTLKALLDNTKSIQGKTIDLLSVDTEGFDFEVLKSNDWKKYKPKVICVEGHEHIEKIDDFLKDKGYKCIYRQTNSIFILED